jgi:hypothetical protein
VTHLQQAPAGAPATIGRTGAEDRYVKWNYAALGSRCPYAASA